MKNRQQVIRASFFATAAAVFVSLAGPGCTSEPANVQTASPPVNQGHSVTSDVVHGWAMIEDEGSSKLGFFNPTSGNVIEPRFTAAGTFCEGLAAVGIESPTGDKIGFIDGTGKMVIEPQYDVGLAAFCEGVASVYVDGKCRFIDRQGRTQIEGGFDAATIFSEGLAAARVGNKWGYIDHRGQMVIPPRFAEAGRFSNGFARVNTGGERNAKGDLQGGVWSIIDFRGQPVNANTAPKH